MNLVTILSVDLNSREGEPGSQGGSGRLSLVFWLAGEGEPTLMRGSGEAIAPSNRALLGLLVGRADTLYNLIHRAPPVTKWTVLPLMILFLNTSNEM